METNKQGRGATSTSHNYTLAGVELSDRVGHRRAVNLPKCAECGTHVVAGFVHDGIEELFYCKRDKGMVETRKALAAGD